MNTTTSLLAVLGMTGTVLLGCSSVSTGEYSAAWSKADPPRTLQLSNGFTLRYLQTGEGPPLVLLHTIRTQLDYFEKLVPALKEHYQVFALDLPGHGQSTILPVEYTEKLFRDSVTEFITQLDLHDVTLAGESIGGALALTVSSELPDRVRHAIALNPYDYGDKFGAAYATAGTAGSSACLMCSAPIPSNRISTGHRPERRLTQPGPSAARVVARVLSYRPAAGLPAYGIFGVQELADLDRSPPGLSAYCDAGNARLLGS